MLRMQDASSIRSLVDPFDINRDRVSPPTMCALVARMSAPFILLRRVARLGVFGIGGARHHCIRQQFAALELLRRERSCSTQQPPPVARGYGHFRVALDLNDVSVAENGHIVHDVVSRLQDRIDEARRHAEAAQVSAHGLRLSWCLVRGERESLRRFFVRLTRQHVSALASISLPVDVAERRDVVALGARLDRCILGGLSRVRRRRGFVRGLRLRLHLCGAALWHRFTYSLELSRHVIAAG